VDVFVGVPSADELHNRAVAARAYKLWLEDPKEGRRYFKAHVRGSFGSGKNMVKAMRRWATALSVRGDLKDADHLRTGRRRKVSDEQTARAIEAFCAGYIVEGEGGRDVWRGFTSLEDAVESGLAATINTILQDTGILVRGLWRRMTSLWPNIRNMRRGVDVKCVLSPEVKEERRKAAAAMRRWATKKLDTVVWIDAKKLYITPGNLQVYTLNPDQVVEDPLLPQGRFNNGKCLHYYSAVNSMTGVISFVWVTGTNGLPSRYTTYVSMSGMDCGTCYTVMTAS
jgi:hypothetical protein